MWYRRECLFTWSAQPRAVATRQTNFEFINNWCHKFQPLLSLPHTPGAAPHLADLSRPSDLFLFYQLPVPLPSSTASSANSQKTKTVARKSIRNSTCQVHDEAANKQRTAPQQPQPLPQVLSQPLLHTLNIPHFVMCVNVCHPFWTRPQLKALTLPAKCHPKGFWTR